MWMLKMLMDKGRSVMDYKTSFETGLLQMSILQTAVWVAETEGAEFLSGMRTWIRIKVERIKTKNPALENHIIPVACFSDSIAGISQSRVRSMPAAQGPWRSGSALLQRIRRRGIFIISRAKVYILFTVYWLREKWVHQEVHSHARKMKRWCCDAESAAFYKTFSGIIYF